MRFLNYLRNPGIIGEKRAYYETTFNELGITIKVRGIRKPNSFPSGWDWLYRTKAERNWKKYRKTQWKED